MKHGHFSVSLIGDVRVSNHLYTSLGTVISPKSTLSKSSMREYGSIQVIYRLLYEIEDFVQRFLRVSA